MVTLDDRVAIVTGASSGSGVFARAPAEAGVGRRSREDGPSDGGAEDRCGPYDRRDA